MNALRTALPIIRSHWSRGYTLLALWVGAAYALALYALANSIPTIGGPL